MFRISVHFRPVSDTNEFELGNVFALLVDGVQIQPKDLKLSEAKTITFNYHRLTFGDNPKKQLGTVVFNADDIVYIDMTQDE